jgi:formylglycine-generating enzyme required for sulfatase activity
VLESAQTWLTRTLASRDETAFIEASVAAEAARKAEERRIARQVQRFRRATVTFCVVVVLALLVASYAGLQTQKAQRYQNEVQWEATYFALKQGRAATLAAGGVILPAVQETHVPADFIATLTQVAELSNWQPVILKDNYGVEMVLVPAGCFWMGSIFQQDEQPAHEVCIDEPFWIDRFEVTNEQFERLGGEAEETGSWPNPDQPRTDITWFEAYGFCRLRDAHLPNEAQWEYSARGPDSLLYPWGNEFVEGNVVHWRDPEEPADVASKPGGASWVGAYDMSGNVWEWVADWYDWRYYDTFGGVVSVNPQGPEDETGKRVLHGGSFNDYDYFLRGAVRLDFVPFSWGDSYGFRCAHLAEE